MTWFRVDDTLAFHHKIVAAGNSAMGLWVRAGAASSQQLTDGFVHDHMVKALGTAGQAKRLVEVGLWDKVPGGYRFHDWEQANPTREQVENERAAARERMQKLRSGSPERSGSVRPNKARTSEEVPDPDPTQPEQPTVVQAAQQRGQRLPGDWIPSEALRSQMAEERPDVDLKAEHLKFLDHWRAKTGRDATKLDWDATWRNWIRNARPTNGSTRPVQPVPAYVEKPAPDRDSLPWREDVS